MKGPPPTLTASHPFLARHLRPFFFHQLHYYLNSLYHHPSFPTWHLPRQPLLPTLRPPTTTDRSRNKDNNNNHHHLHSNSQTMSTALIPPVLTSSSSATMPPTEAACEATLCEDPGEPGNSGRPKRPLRDLIRRSGYLPRRRVHQRGQDRTRAVRPNRPNWSEEATLGAEESHHQIKGTAGRRACHLATTPLKTIVDDNHPPPPPSPT